MRFLRLTGVVIQEGGQFVSYCKQVPVSACGSSVPEAFQSLNEATHLFFRQFAEMGETAHVMKKYRLRPVRQASLESDGMVRVGCKVPSHTHLVAAFLVPLPEQVPA